MTKVPAAVMLAFSLCFVQGLAEGRAVSRDDASSRQVRNFLKANPDLRTGMRLRDGTTVKAQRAIPGGIRYRVSGLPRGQVVMVDVTGPPHLLAKGFLDTLWDDVKKAASAVAQLRADVEASGGPGGNESQDCVGIDVDGASNTVSVSAGPDSKVKCAGAE
jgi:hypothetical protein